ncbi:MAG: hypothetical protein ACT4P1_12455 [Sporichthyaceae bacterium]
MRMNRTGILAALSAAAIVGLPMTTAAPAAAVPYVEYDDPPAPSDAPESEAPEAPVLLDVPIIPVTEGPVGVDEVLNTDDPVSENDVDEVVVSITQPTGPALDAAEDAGVADLREDEVEAADEESAPAPTVPDSPAPETTQDDNKGERESENSDAPTGDFNDAGEEQEAEASADAAVPETAEVAGNPQSGQRTTSTRTPSGVDTETTVSGVGVQEMAAASVNQFGGVLPDTGAASTAILQTGIALLAGGILLAGTGRHRRISRASATN